MQPREVEEREIEKLKIVREVFDQAIATDTCEEGLHAIIQACRKVFDCQTAAFLLCSGKNDVLRIKSSIGIGQQFANTFAIAKEANPQWELVERRTELVLEKDKSRPQLLSAFRLERDIKYALVLPVYSAGHDCGYFQCERDGAPYDEVEQEFLRIFVRMAGVLVCKARFCERMKLLEGTDEELGTLTSNRFFDRLNEELKRSERYNEDVAVMLVHFDAYPDYINYHGEGAGKALIKVLANVIRGCVREHDLVSRYGVQLFALCLLKVEAKAAMKTANRIIKAFLNSDVEHREPELKISIGVVQTSEVGFEVRKIIRCARTALLDSQRAGKNRAHLYKRKV